MCLMFKGFEQKGIKVLDDTPLLLDRATIASVPAVPSIQQAFSAVSEQLGQPLSLHPTGF